MRVVADTNTVVSGPPRGVLDAARSGGIRLFISAILLAELEDVLGRAKLASRLALAQTTARDLTLGYAALATFVTPPPLSPVILADPDDDAVLACALAANAHVIISGDQHLLNLGKYGQISILSAAEFLETIPSRR